MRHVPVLLEETIRLLQPERGGLVVDCTVGLGGHAEALLEASSSLRLIGIDRDPQALEMAEVRLRPFGARVKLAAGNFADLEALLHQEGVEAVDGILADLGVSSLQLERAERGFSFRREGPLDMRMGPGRLTAGMIVNDYSETDLEQVLREFGEEPQARRIARAVVRSREQKAIETTTELSGIVGKAKAGRGRQRPGRIDPATRVFQALRIEVNRELLGLEALLDQAVRLLEKDGRLVVISYHSLEDRIVKNTFRDLARGEVDEITGRTRSESRVIEVLTKKPIRPSEEEVAANPRSRSARLRAARRL
ncbi:MAG: 16S rRNA (cytosine(1402)-N(4))-methyltransferase RsmH [Acidobacteria bacterium]|nr:MAG: 16S rRNA (cytosine(1402)-N(4))-methyltransferase RsmH [Acidobacteriota bacterium]